MTTYAVQCLECDARADHDTRALALALEFEPCETCEADVGEAIELEPCPNGITAADWSVGGYIGPACDDDEHEPKSGMHIRSVEP